MRKNKLMAIMLASTMMIAGCGITASASSNSTTNTNSSSHVALLGQTDVSGEACVINGNGNLVLTNANGKTLSYISVGEMLQVEGTQGNLVKVTVQETGATGYINKSNVLNIIDSNTTDITRMNRNSQIINVSSVVNVRTAPSLGASVVSTLTNGTQVKITGKTGNWYRVNINGTKGYIFGLYLSGSELSVPSNTTTNTNKTVTTTTTTTTVTPNQTTPVVKPSQTTPVVKPGQTTPVVKPGQTTPVNKPDHNHKEQQGRLNLTIMNVETGKPLANTVIQINGQDWTTNANGQIDGLSLWTTPQTLKITSKGFEATSVNVQTEANKTIDKTVNIAPITANEVVTVINKDTKKPVVNTKVNVGGVTLTTNAKGQVTLSNLWAGKQSFNVSIANYKDATLNFTSVAGKTGNTTLEVTPAKAADAQTQGRLNLTIMNVETGKPLANTKIQINGQNWTTNSKGQIDGLSLWTTPQTLKITSTGFEATSINVQTEANKTIDKTVNIAPITANEVVTVINKDTKAPLANTKVEIGGVTLTSNAKGQVTLSNLWAGKQSFNVSIANYKDATLDFTSVAGKTGNTTLEVTPVKAADVQTQGRLNLTVMNVETGVPLANTKIQINGQNWTTNSKGQIDGLSLWTTPQTLKITSKGFEATSVNVQTEADKTIDKTVNIAPITANEVVTVINKDTKAPLANTKVNIGGVTLTTNAKGQVTMSNLWAGQQSFTVSIAHYKDATLNFTSVAGKTGNTTLEVTPVEAAQAQGRLNLTIMNVETGAPLANTKIQINGQDWTTNAKGQIDGLSLVTVPQTLKITSKGFEATSVNVQTEANKTIDKTVNIAPETANQVVTFVNNLTNEPIANTIVNIGGVKLKTNAKGEATIGNLWAGEQSFDVSIKNFASSTLNFDAVSGVTGYSTVRVNPDQGRVVFTVVNAKTGKALANANVTLQGRDFTTNSKGQIDQAFSFQPVAQNITIGSKGFKSATVSVQSQPNQTINQVVKLSEV